MHYCANMKVSTMTEDQPCCTGLTNWLSPAFFKALGDPNRVSILASLAEGGHEQTVTEVATCCSVDLSVVSRHLHILRDAGILQADKRGKQVYYTVRARELVGLLRNLADALERCCPDGTCEIREE